MVEIKEKNKQSNAKGVKRAQRRLLNPRAIFAPAPRPGVHGLYIDPVKVDRRTRIAQLRKGLKAALLERFPAPAPAAAQILADRAAVKILRVAAYEAFVLAGNSPSDTANQSYLSLCESIRKDLTTLWQMSRDGVGEKVPDLREYLEILHRAERAQVIKLEESHED
jgi:hypothetical protein